MGGSFFEQRSHIILYEMFSVFSSILQQTPISPSCLWAKRHSLTKDVSLCALPAGLCSVTTAERLLRSADDSEPHCSTLQNDDHNVMEIVADETRCLVCKTRRRIQVKKLCMNKTHKVLTRDTILTSNTLRAHTSCTSFPFYKSQSTRNVAQLCEIRVTPTDA